MSKIPQQPTERTMLEQMSTLQPVKDTIPEQMDIP